jgi:hypothetical protein
VGKAREQWPSEDIPTDVQQKLVSVPMRSPRLVPETPTYDAEVCLVLDDFGHTLGRAWREADAEAADRETVIGNLMTGQYEKPVRIVAFNTAEGWARDITEDVAREVVRRARDAGSALPASTRAFAEYQLGEACN